MAGLADAAAELEALAFRLRRAGDTELLREVTKAMRDAVDPVEDQIRAGLEPTSPKLPDRYAAELDADLRIGTNVRTNERDPGVAITGQALGKTRKLRDLDAGRIHHPLFGDREKWFLQEEPSVQPGWFTGPAEAGGPRVRTAIERALADVADKAVKGA
jgi:hypothetical protein